MRARLEFADGVFEQEYRSMHVASDLPVLEIAGNARELRSSRAVFGSSERDQPLNCCAWDLYLGALIACGGAGLLSGASHSFRIAE